MAIRNLGYIAWKNNLSWLEKQEGSKWDALLEKENKKFLGALDKLTIPKHKTTSENGEKWKGWTITSDPFAPEKILSRGSKRFKCWDFDMSEELLVLAIQNKDGFE